MKKKDVDSDLVRHLADLLDETGLNEIEYEKDGSRIRVGKGTAQVAAAPAAVAPVQAAAPTGQAKAESHDGTVLRSPMVGTVYLSPEPAAATFVKVGDTVTEGQTMLIIEAMKVMNPIGAPKAGKVTKVLVSDAQPVEFGEELVVIE